MSSLTQVFNRITGKMEGEIVCKDYDYHQEITRTGFADMLHDTERNQKYYAALKKTIDNLHAEKKEAHVLDIGTGTGILSMMAVKCGADSVTACEAFTPMAKCAKKVIADNGMADKIHLVMKRSTAIKVDKAEGDMKRKANVLVTELFDTELIGEGAISIFNHAHSNLLTDDCIVIPSSAIIYAQVFESNLAVSWNKPKILANLDGEVLLTTPREIIECPGDAAVHDLQLSQLTSSRSNCMKPLSNPIEIFIFNFNTKTPINNHCSKTITRQSIGCGIAQVVFFWWELTMDQTAKIKISCAPFWAHPNFNDLQNEVEETCHKTPIQNRIPWRDHWMQAIYYLATELRLQKNQEFFLNANHDEFSFWFNISGDIQEAKKTIIETTRHVCICRFHSTYSRTRIGQINQSRRNKIFLKILESLINKDSNVLCLGEGSLLQLATAKLGAKSVTILEQFSRSKKCLESYVIENKLNNVKFVGDVDALTNLDSFTNIVCEPFFITSIYPWDNFYYGTLLSSIQSKLNKNINIMPRCAKLYAIPIEFLDLDKIQRPVGICEGFNLSAFDIFIENSSTRNPQAKVEVHPLWEYPGRALGNPENLLNVDFKNYLQSKNESIITFTIQTSGSLNGVGIWVDWDLDGSNDPKSIVTTGPNEPIEIGELISWDMFVRQGVILIPNAVNVQPGYTFNMQFLFKPEIGKMLFNFDKF